MNTKFHTAFAAAALVVAFAAAALVVAFAIATPASAGAPDRSAATAPAETVRFSDLDLTTPSGVGKLYQRIQLAAFRVCRDIVPVENGPSGIANARCRRQLVDRAVVDANRPALTALHTNRSVPLAARR